MAVPVDDMDAPELHPEDAKECGDVEDKRVLEYFLLEIPLVLAWGSALHALFEWESLGLLSWSLFDSCFSRQLFFRQKNPTNTSRKGGLCVME